jgi:predicted SnoaL-like aldol condensation-catalyzing enzyme
MQSNAESHTEKAVRFLELASSGEVDEAYERFAAPAGKHHSPHFAAGFEALKAGMKDNHQQFPDKKMTVKHAVGEGNLVAVHSHVVLKPGDLGAATMHLFRFEGGKIVELWDFAHPVPAGSPNADGLF